MAKFADLFAKLSLLLALSVSGGAFANQREEAIKSGFIYNFARYSQGKWFNPQQSTTYNICSFDSNFVDIAKHTLKGSTIAAASVVLQQLDPHRYDLSSCNTLFITKGDQQLWENLSTLQTFSNVMLVGEFDGFIAMGGHINFFIVGGKVRFEVNPQALKRAGINMSSKVLRLGRSNNGDS